MAQRKAGKAKAVVDVDAALSEVEERLNRDGAVKLNELKPKALRDALVPRLVEKGFEATKAQLRRPLLAQLNEALSHGALVPVTALASHVQGATGPELKAAVALAVKSGRARLVLRGKAEVLCGPEVKVVDSAQLTRIRDRALALSKLVEKVTKKPGLMLLAQDLDEALTELRSAVPAVPVTEKKPEDDGLAALLSAVDSTRDARSGLSFVPAIVGRLAPEIATPRAIELLMAAAARELLELRPEGGIGRLSEAELSVCPPGPHGTKLSWVRRLGGGAA
jgi:hypothetical protein